ncbi:MAG: nicotinate (nicotinamide) nucleotide adenylyltransferase [Bdellovibrionales bacterium]|nr:nicotinate (nicotinamide) nucleotide adenylyltransferase [Bdellovibrionales bacterium]
MKDVVRRRIGLYGGSFDPPHLGHVITITAVLNSGLVDEVWLVPSGLHRDKEMHATDANRHVMIEIMLSTSFGSKVPVKLDTIQLHDSSRVSTTIELIRAEKHRFKDCEFSVVIGSDLLPQLPKWYQAKDLLSETHFLVMPRPGHDLPKKMPPYASAIISDGLATSNISSSLVRRLIADRKSLEGIVPPAVINHIIRYKLYGYDSQPHP